jgi:hypothetical protein
MSDRTRRRIHAGTITGQILGESLPVSLPGGFEGITEFTFPGIVPLQPGGLFVIEAVVLSGDEWAVGRTHGLSQPFLLFLLSGLLSDPELRSGFTIPAALTLGLHGGRYGFGS